MADKKDFTVVHPVRHNGKLVGRGKSVELTDKEAERLLGRGVITTEVATEIIVVNQGPTPAETVALFTKLNAMNKGELVEYGRTTYGLELGDDKKEALVAALHARFIDAYVPPAPEAEVQA